MIRNFDATGKFIGSLPNLTDDVVHHITMNVGQPRIASGVTIGQLRVVKI